STGRSTKLIPPERGNARVRRPGLTIKEVPGIEGAVAQKLVRRAVEGIGARLRHDADLSAGTVAELRPVHVRNDIEFPHCLDPEQLSTDAARSRADGVGHAGVFHSILQKDVFSGPAPGLRTVGTR